MPKSCCPFTLQTFVPLVLQRLATSHEVAVWIYPCSHARFSVLTDDCVAKAANTAIINTAIGNKNLIFKFFIILLFKINGLLYFQVFGLPLILQDILLFYEI